MPSQPSPAAAVPVQAVPVQAVPWTLIVLAASTIAAVGMGIRQTMGLFLKPMPMELGIGREDFALAIALAKLVWGLAAPVTGAIADKAGAGRVVVFGATSTALGLIGMWASTSRLHLLVSGVFLGLGVAGAGINALFDIYPPHREE